MVREKKVVGQRPFLIKEGRKKEDLLSAKTVTARRKEKRLVGKEENQ